MSISLVPAEVKQMILGYLPVGEQFKAMAVCKEWKGHVDEVLKRAFWKPIVEQFSLRDPTRMQPYADDEIKSAVLAYLQKYKELPDVIIDLIDKDEALKDKDAQLAAITGRFSVSLSKLKQMPRIERMLFVMRGLKQDCTELFTYLTTRHQRSYADVLKKDQRAGSEVTPGTSTLQFHETDPCLALILKHIKAPPGPFSGSAVMSAVCPVIEIASSEKIVRDICAEIIKGHHHIVDFLEAKIVLQQRGESFPQAFEFIYTMLKPQMDRYNPDVTDGDWIACGLVPFSLSYNGMTVS